MNRHITKIHRINRASEKTIGKFSATESKLAEQNAQIDTAITKLDEEITQLNELKIAATFRREENHGIITRIGALIRGK